MTRYFAFIGVFTLGVGLTATPPVFSQAAPNAVAYEATVEIQNGTRMNLAHIFYDHGKFREEEPGQPIIQFYDGNKQGVVWDYYTQTRRACPTPNSSIDALCQEERRLGAAAVLRKYHLGASFPKEIFAGQPTSNSFAPAFGLRTLAELRPLPWKPVGKGLIAGRSCVIFVGRYTPRHPKTVVRDGGATVKGDWGQTDRAWIDPKTGLVLRLEERTEPPANSPIPPRQTLRSVISFRVFSRLPTTRFALPAGARATVPLIFRSVSLPPGVTRVPATGGFAGIGINYR